MVPRHELYRGFSSKAPKLFRSSLISLEMSMTNIVKFRSQKQGPRSKFSSGGAKEECVKENFFGGGGGGGMLVDFYSISLK